MTPILLAVLPLIVTGLTSLIKRTPVVSKDASSEKRDLVIRGIAAVLSLLGVLGSFMLSGALPDPAILSDLVTTIALTFMVFIGSIGAHSVAKKD